jgi:hypothetical protein
MRLYKYLPAARVDVIERAHIRFSPPHAFNDPFDLKPNIEGFDSPTRWNSQFAEALPKALEEQYALLPEPLRNSLPLSVFLERAKTAFPQLSADYFRLAQGLTPVLRSTIESKFEELVGILSLTENSDSLLMWAHYASSQEGFVIEVDPTSSFFNRRRSENDEFFHLRPVRYHPDRPTLSFSTEDPSFEVFLTKGLDWKYESEWRMLVPLSGADEVITNGKVGVHLFRFPKSMIKSIIIGARAIDETKVRILRALKDPEYGHVLVQRAVAESAAYRLSFRPLDG